jgi:hypothetical protein
VIYLKHIKWTNTNSKTIYKIELGFPVPHFYLANIKAYSICNMRGNHIQNARLIQTTFCVVTLIDSVTFVSVDIYITKQISSDK